MRYPSALFVTPSAAGRYFGGVRPPVGIAYVEEFVARHGVRTSARDMTLGPTPRDLFRRIEREHPSIVGVTTMSYQYLRTYSLVAEVKRRFPGTKIVLGGAHVCALGGETLRQCPSADYAIAGEGELPMRDLCIGVPYEDIPGLQYRVDGQVRNGGPPRLVENLDHLPFPRYSSYPLERYANEIEISTSRGCPHGCIFCAVSNIMGRRVRFRDVRSVGEEVEYFHRRGVRSIQIGDDNFLIDKERLRRLLAELRGRRLEGLILRCGQGVRADDLTREILLEMKEAGFRHLGIGVESASDRVLEVVGKRSSVAKIERGITLACEMGFDVSLFFVVGSPTENLADVRESIRLAKKYPVMKAFFFNLIPFPATTLYEWVCERGALLAPYEELINRADELKLRSRPFFETEEMPEEDRLLALKMTERASKDIQVRALRRKLASLGPLSGIAAQAARSDALERFFVRHRRFRQILDRVVFRA